MKLIVSLAFSLLVVVAAGTKQQDTAMGGWGAATPYNRLYSETTELTVSGTIQSLHDTVPPIKAMAPATIATLKLSSGEEMIVHLGPAWFLSNLKPTLAEKDQVTVTGSLVVVEDSRFILARKVVKGDRVLYLRELNGFPLWVATRQYHDTKQARSALLNMRNVIGAESIAGRVAIVAPPPKEELQPRYFQGTVTNTYTSQNMQTGQTDTFLVVKTDQGEYTIDLGPNWFVQQQPVSIPSGSNVLVQANQPAAQSNPLTFQVPGMRNVYFANGIAMGNQLLVTGIPGYFQLWSPWSGQ